MPLNKIIRSSMRVLYKLTPRSIDDTISITELMLQQHIILVGYQLIAAYL